MSISRIPPDGYPAAGMSRQVHYQQRLFGWQPATPYCSKSSLLKSCCDHFASKKQSVTMRSSPLFSRSAIGLGLSFISRVSAQSIPGASLFVGGGAPGAASYQLVDDYEGPGGNFFNKFNFYSVRLPPRNRNQDADSAQSYDPTYGHVQYVEYRALADNSLRDQIRQPIDRSPKRLRDDLEFGHRSHQCGHY